MFNDITIHKEQALGLMTVTMALKTKSPEEILEGSVKAFEIAVDRRLNSDAANRVTSPAVRELMAATAKALRDSLSADKAKANPTRTARTVVLLAPALLEGFDYLDVLLDNGYSGEQKDQTIVNEEVIAS